MSESRARNRYKRYLNLDNPTDIPARTRFRYNKFITNEVYVTKVYLKKLIIEKL